MSTQKHALLIITLFISLMLLLSLSSSVLADNENVPVIDTVKINGAKVNFKDGESPKFTAESAEPELYSFDAGSGAFQMWRDVDTDQFITTSQFYNNRWSEGDSSKLIDKFIAGHKYTYTIAVQAVDLTENNNFACSFTENTKLKVNEILYENVQGSVEDYFGIGYAISFYNFLTITIENEEEISGKNTASNMAFAYLGENAENIDFTLPEDAKITVTTQENVLKEVVMGGYDNTIESMALNGSMDLVVEVEVVGYTSDKLPVTVILPIPTNYNASSTTIKLLDGTIIRPESADAGSAIFNLDLTKSIYSEGHYYTDHATIYFKKSDNVTTETEETKTLTTDNSSNNVKVTIDVEDVIKGGATVNVKEIKIDNKLQTAEKKLKKVFDISVLDANDKVVKVENNKMKITIDLDKELTGYKYYQVVYIKDGKIAERLPATVKDGKLTFTTTHLSEYGIVVSNTPLEEKDNSPKTGDITIVYASILTIVTLCGIAVVTKKIKE